MSDEKDQTEQAQPVAEEADMQERVKAFTDELRPLMGKYELGLGSQGMLTPDGRITSRPVIVSTRVKPEAPDAKKDAGLSEG